MKQNKLYAAIIITCMNTVSILSMSPTTQYVSPEDVAAANKRVAARIEQWDRQQNEERAALVRQYEKMLQRAAERRKQWQREEQEKQASENVNSSEALHSLKAVTSEAELGLTSPGLTTAALQPTPEDDARSLSFASVPAVINSPQEPTVSTHLTPKTTAIAAPPRHNCLRTIALACAAPLRPVLSCLMATCCKKRRSDNV